MAISLLLAFYLVIPRAGYRFLSALSCTRQPISSHSLEQTRYIQPQSHNDHNDQDGNLSSHIQEYFDYILLRLQQPASVGGNPSQLGISYLDPHRV